VFPSTVADPPTSASGWPGHASGPDPPAPELDDATLLAFELLALELLALEDAPPAPEELEVPLGHAHGSKPVPSALHA
jgi:hypothetical protein